MASIGFASANEKVFHKMVTSNVTPKILLIGGAGFIGLNICKFFSEKNYNLVVYDKLFHGSNAYLESLIHDSKVTFIKDDVLNWEKHSSSMEDVDLLIHLASNSDISAAIHDPTVDFFSGTLLSQKVAEIARVKKIENVIYLSGSGVYGDTKGVSSNESDPLLPDSPYGASKVAGESIFRAYSNLFGTSVVVLRMANIVGPFQTHGVVYDFINKLNRDGSRLEILGDGTQTKNYLHVNDLISAIQLFLVDFPRGFNVYNVSSDDQIRVEEIANLVVSKVLGNTQRTELVFQDSPRGWPGDIPIVSLDNNKLKSRGWQPTLNSANAIEKSILELVENCI